MWDLPTESQSESGDAVETEDFSDGEMFPESWSAQMDGAHWRWGGAVVIFCITFIYIYTYYLYIYIYIYTYIFWLVVWKPGWVIWCYPPVNIQKTMENHNFNGKTHYKWSFSIAMVLNHAMDEELDIFWLLVWNMVFMTFHILGMSSSQVTSIFQRGRYTTNQYYLGYYRWVRLMNWRWLWISQSLT